MKNKEEREEDRIRNRIGQDREGMEYTDGVALEEGLFGYDLHLHYQEHEEKEANTWHTELHTILAEYFAEANKTHNSLSNMTTVWQIRVGRSNTATNVQAVQAIGSREPLLGTSSTPFREN